MLRPRGLVLFVGVLAAVAAVGHIEDVTAQADAAMPTFTARVGADSSRTTIVFSEPVHGVLDADNWLQRIESGGFPAYLRVFALQYGHNADKTVFERVDRVNPVTLSADDAITELVLEHNPTAFTAGTVYVSYGSFAPHSNAGSSLVDSDDNPVFSTSNVVVGASTVPVVLRATFADDLMGAVVEFSEGVTTSGTWTISPSLGTVTASPSAGESLEHRIVLGFTMAATPGTTYVIGVPDELTDRGTPPTKIAPGTTYTIMTLGTQMAVFTATAVDLETTHLAFSDSVPMGTIDTDHWTASEEITTRTGTATVDKKVLSIALGAQQGAPVARAAVAGPPAVAKSTHTIADDSTVSALVITHEPLGDTSPFFGVTYTKPASGGITLGDAPGVALETDTVFVIDAIPPTFGARAISLTETDIAFSETVVNSAITTDGSTPTLMLDRENWRVDGVRPDSIIRTASLYTLTHDPLESTGSTPTVEYVAPAVPIRDSLGTNMAETGQRVSVVATESIPPLISITSPPRVVGNNIVVTFSEEMRASAELTASTTNSGSGPASVTAVPMVAGPVMTFPLGSGARAGTWTLTIPETVTDAAGTPRSASAAAVRATYPEDTTGPMMLSAVISNAATTSSVLVTLDDKIHGGFGASAALPGGDTSIGAVYTESRDEILFTFPLQSNTGVRSGDVLEITNPATVTDRSIPPNAISQTTVQLTDMMRPVLTRVEFVDSEHIVATFSEPVRGPNSGWRVITQLSGETGLDVERVDYDLSTARLSVDEATAAISYIVLVSSAITDTSTAQNTLPTQSRIAIYTPGNFVAKATGLETTAVTFDGSMGGLIDTDNWKVDVGETDFPITRIALGNAANAPAATPATQEIAKSTHMISDSSSEKTLVISHAPLASPDSMPSVSYTQPVLRGQGIIMPVPGSLSVAGSPVPTNSDLASDGITPTFSAMTGEMGQTAVTFDEPVSGTIRASEWMVGSAVATGVASSGAGEADPLIELDDTLTFVLWHVSLGGTDLTPTVTYMPTT